MAGALYKIWTDLNNLKRLNALFGKIRKNSTNGFKFAQVVIVCMAITQFVFFFGSLGSIFGPFLTSFAKFSFFVF